MAELNDDQAEALLRLVSDTAAEEIVCEDFRRDVAAYYTKITAGVPLGPKLQLVDQHRKACPECDEEFQLLVELEAEGTAD